MKVMHRDLLSECFTIPLLCPTKNNRRIKYPVVICMLMSGLGWSPVHATRNCPKLLALHYEMRQFIRIISVPFPIERMLIMCRHLLSIRIILPCHTAPLDWQSVRKLNQNGKCKNIKLPWNCERNAFSENNVESHLIFSRGLFVVGNESMRNYCYAERPLSEFADFQQIIRFGCCWWAHLHYFNHTLCDGWR